MRSAVALVLALLLSACGGGGGGPPKPPAPAPERGDLVGAAGMAMEKLEPPVFAALLELGQPGTTKITGDPQCAITTYTVRYHTVGGAGEATEASAAVIVPSGDGGSCSGARPVLLYAHATSVEKSYDMANLRENRESRLVAAVFAARGYIVVAPNYAGYARSSLAYHPYLNADQQGADMIDALRAARLAFAAIGANASAKLVVTGYSQGGYVALATQRAMESMNSAGFAPAAVAGLSGPYALAQFGDTQFAGAPRIGVTAFLPMLISAGQLSGEHVYGSTSEVYEEPYAATIETLMPGVGTVGDLVSAGKLPANALFAADSMPQADGYGRYFGPGNLIKTVFRDAYLADMKAHPCDLNGGVPLACAPENALRKLFRKNDLRDYEPVAPLLLCGGSGDPTVPYLNTRSALAYFYLRHPGQLIEVDLDDTPGLRDPYRTPKLSFIAAKVALRAAAISNGDSPDQAVETNYHAGLAAPFCMLATRDFFQEVLALN